MPMVIASGAGTGRPHYSGVLSQPGRPTGETLLTLMHEFRLEKEFVWKPSLAAVVFAIKTLPAQQTLDN
jgi:hypothetical protein